MPLPELKYTKNVYPQSPDDTLPRQYFVGLFIAPRGVGKTYSACQLIKAYENSPPITTDGKTQAVRTFVITPTWEANECFRSLNSIDEEDVYESYTPEVVVEIIDKIKATKAETEDYQRRLKLWKRFKRIRDVKQLNEEDIFDLDAIGFEEPIPPAYPNGVSNFLVVDDMVGSQIFKQGRNPFTQLLLKNRHLALNFAIMSQNLKSIPKAIRQNTSVWYIGKYGSRAFLTELYEETASALLTESEFEKKYDEATGEQYGALVIDFTKPAEKRFSVSWRRYI